MRFVKGLANSKLTYVPNIKSHMSLQKGSGKHEGLECGEVHPELGGTLSGDSHDWDGGLLLGGYGRATPSPTMERV